MHIVYPIEQVSVATRPQYIPQARREAIQETQFIPVSNGIHNSKWRKVVIDRFSLEDGNISFSLGTKFGGAITRDDAEVTLAKILDHVTLAELERFENADFLAEDLREEEQARLDALIPKKLRGRPKKNISGQSSRTVSLAPGRSTAINKPTDRLRSFAVVVPPFRRPRPNADPIVDVPEISTKASSATSTTGSESEPDNPSRIPAYSMMQASGLIIEDSQDEVTSRDVTTSRDLSPDELGPSPKKRKVSSGRLYMDTISPLTQSQKIVIENIRVNECNSQSLFCSPEPSSREVKVIPSAVVDSLEISEADICDSEDERSEQEPLIRQFLPKMNHGSTTVSPAEVSITGSNCLPTQDIDTHRQRDDLDMVAEGNHFQAIQLQRRSPPANLTTDRPMAAIPRKPDPIFSQYNRHTAPSISPNHFTSPLQTTLMRRSMTPYFPYQSKNSPTKQRKISSTSPMSKVQPMQHKEADKGKPSNGNQRSRSNVEAPELAVISAPTSSQMRLLGPQPIPKPKDITSYFTPRSILKNPSQLPIVTSSYTNSNILDKPKTTIRESFRPRPLTDDDSGSDDPITRSPAPRQVSLPFKTNAPGPKASLSHSAQSSSSDSMNSKVFVTNRAKPKHDHYQMEPKGDSKGGYIKGSLRYHVQDSERSEYSDEDEDSGQDEVSLIHPSANGHSRSRNEPVSTTSTSSIPIAPKLRGSKYRSEDESMADEDDERTQSSSGTDSMNSRILVVPRR